MQFFSKESDSFSFTSKSFRESHTFEKRLQESQRIIAKFPDRVPVIVEKAPHRTPNIPDIDKKKYLVPKDLTVGQFIYVIRQRLKLGPEHALFMFINNTIPKTSDLITNEYENKKDDDGFLYITYTGESTFG